MKKTSKPENPNVSEKEIDLAVEHLRENSAEYLKGLDSEGVVKMTTFCLRKAKGYGFSELDDLLTFVTTMFQIAPNFDCQPRIRAVLLDQSIPPEKKFDVLTDESMDDAWEEADKSYDPEAWLDDEDDEADDLT